MTADTEYIEQVIDVAAAAMADGHRPFGALLVHDDEVVETAQSITTSGTNSIEHTEFRLARRAVDAFDPDTRANCTMYTSNEPCPMCAGAIYYAGLGRVVFSVSRERFAEIASLGGIDISCQEVFERADDPAPSVTGPLLEDHGAELHRQYEYGE